MASQFVVRLSGMKKPLKVAGKLQAVAVFRRVSGVYYTLLGLLFDPEKYLDKRGSVCQDRCGVECDLLIGKPVKWSLEAALIIACYLHLLEPGGAAWNVVWDLFRNAGKPGKGTIPYDDAISFTNEILSVYGLYDEETLFAAAEKDKEAAA